MTDAVLIRARPSDLMGSEFNKRYRNNNGNATVSPVYRLASGGRAVLVGTSNKSRLVRRKALRMSRRFRRYRRIRPRTEIKVFYYSNNVNGVAPQPLQSTTTAGPLNWGYFGNQLAYFFTPPQNTTRHGAIGNKVVVKSIHYKFHFMQGEVPDTAPIAPTQIPFNIRVVILKLRNNDGANHFDIASLLSVNGDPSSVGWATQGKTVMNFGESVKTTTTSTSNFDILLNRLIELDSGYKTESLEGKIKCGFTCTFFETFSDTALYNHTWKNQLICCLLTDQNYGDGTKYPYFRANIKTKFYDS